MEQSVASTQRHTKCPVCDTNLIKCAGLDFSKRKMCVICDMSFFLQEGVICAVQFCQWSKNNEVGLMITLSKDSFRIFNLKTFEENVSVIFPGIDPSSKEEIEYYSKVLELMS